MKKIVFSLLLAAAFWFVMFFPALGMEWNFWAVMTAASLTLTTLAVCFGGWPQFSHANTYSSNSSNNAWDSCSLQVRLTWQEVTLGVGIAIVLWCVFWTGDKCSQWLFDFARPQVELIYGIKGGTSPTVIGLLLLFIIGPGEEIFWRGYIQRRLSARFSPNTGFLLATAAYTLIHVASLNFMLIMAAMVCGIAWGGLYRLMPQHFTAIVISHALWDAAAFVWLPF